MVGLDEPPPANYLLARLGRRSSHHVTIVATIVPTSVCGSRAESVRQTRRPMATSSTVVSANTLTRSAGDQSSALIVLVAMIWQTSRRKDGRLSREHRYSRTRIA